LKLYKNVRWHATEQQELNDIHKVFDIPTGTISVTLAVDTPSIKFAEVNFLPKLKNQLQLIYLSLITEKKNLLDLFSALKVIPPHIRIKLNVYGPIKDKNYWDKCLSTSLSLPSHIVFSYGGIVDPKDTLEIIQQHHFFILPTRGENFGHAIYESFLASRPVIISDCTPWKALEEREAGFVFFIGQPTLSTYIERAAEMDEATYVRYCHGAQKVAKDYLASNNFREQYLNLFQA
jgi:glycosyltransferase involved in cell wall biosynthesis